MADSKKRKSTLKERLFKSFRKAKKIEPPADAAAAGLVLRDFIIARLEMRREYDEAKKEIGLILGRLLKYLRPKGRTVFALAQTLQLFAEQQRPFLASGKTIALATGTLSWRETPAGPEARIHSRPKAIAWLWSRAHKDPMYRDLLKIDLNEAALRSHPELANQIPGVEIVERQTEERFYLEADGEKLTLDKLFAFLDFKLF
ncbi:MAG TPA: host-nuclease inhibitor Gam family protein [Patescibacteria group bacterium]|nr:host-nuclease inhibitor Gam family protein [Patescibacteria group bacterium]